MKIILLTDVEGLGSRGQVVSVADGYARNFLLPKNRALRASASAAKVAADLNRAADRKERHVREEALGRLEKLQGVKVTFVVNAGEEGKLFGSVTSHDIADELAKRELGFEIDRKDVLLPEPIKLLGQYKVPVKLFRDVRADVEVWVVPHTEEGEAEAEPKEVEDRAEDIESASSQA